MRASVSSSLSARVAAPATVELQVAVAGAAPADEQLVVTLDGVRAEVVEHPTEAGGRLHLLTVPAGVLQVDYRASLAVRTGPVATGPLDEVSYRRPSRYAEADRLAGLAHAEFGGLSDPGELVTAVAAWVGSRLAYVPGSSSGTDGAVDSLLAGNGVCRDFAHVVVALLRARDVPARTVAVYAPGLAPMDFHAVAEALVDGVWCVVDATLLAPRQSLLRIATGRDAADTAFLSSYGGDLQLDRLEVTAVVDGDLPVDDLDQLVALA